MKLSQAFRITMICVIVVFSAGTALADIPLLVNYQGRLADDNDQPVTDDIYEMAFSLWNDSTSTSHGDVIWNSGTVKVKVTNGLFSYNLGENSELLPEMLIDRTDLFLNVYIGGYGNIIPRQRITSVGFSFQSLFADTAYEIAGDPYLRADGDTLRGELYFQTEGGQDVGKLELTSSAANMYLYNSGHMSSILFGTSYGSLYLHQHNGTKTASLDSRYSLGGLLRLTDPDGTTTVELDGGSTGDNAAILPESSVNSDELFNEPGIVHTVRNGSTTEELGDSYAPYDSVVINLPEAGYVYLSSSGYISFFGDVFSGVYIQISNLATSTVTNQAIYVFCDPSSSILYSTAIPFSVDRVFYESSAGTYTYYLQAKRTNTVAEDINMGRYRMTAMYFPTSYGSVYTVSSYPGDDPEATAVSYTDETGQPQTDYVTDLRYYELKAKEARLKALEAELELEKAREAAAERERLE